MERPTSETTTAGHQLCYLANGEADQRDYLSRPRLPTPPPSQWRGGPDSRAQYIRREFFEKRHSIIVSPAEQFSSSIVSHWQLRSNLSNNQGVIVCNIQGVVVFNDQEVICRNYRTLLYNLTIRMTNKFTFYVLLWLSFITIPQYPTDSLY
jgi:hypothetical protein